MELMEDGTTIEQQMFAMATEKKVPLYGVLELLPLCNLNCDMCYVRMSREEMEEVGRLRTMEEWTKTAEDMMRAGTLFVLLTGGEPLLYPHFRELYQKLRELGMIITINTNGTLIDEAWADFFAENKPRRINITLYGADDQAYGKLCHYPAGFQKTVNAIRMLRDREIDVKINGSITSKNEEDIKKILDIAKQYDAAVNLDTYMYPASRERNKPFDEQSRMNPKDAAMAKVLIYKYQMGDIAFEEYRRAIINTIEQYIPENYGYERHISCLAGNCSFTINWQGMIRPCVMQSMPQVNVFDKGFLQGWETISNETKKILINEACVSCRYRPICNTCAAAALLETGNYDGIPEYICEYTKEFYRIMKEGARIC